MEISKNQNTLLRGIAITLIVGHNLFHWFPHPVVKEWEFQINSTNIPFSADNFSTVILAFENVFSFWGWYGVVIFVFLSGYGLAMKYKSINEIKLSIYTYNHFI